MKTKISDVIVPEVFNPYVIQRTMELSALYQCGIIANNPELDRLATAGGSTFYYMHCVLKRVLFRDKIKLTIPIHRNFYPYNI